MYGDRLMLYNTKTGKFFVRFDKHWSIKKGSSIRDIWTNDYGCAWTTTALGSIQRKRAQLGPDVRIISETQARKILEVRALDEEYRAAEGKPSVLFAER